MPELDELLAEGAALNGRTEPIQRRIVPPPTDPMAVARVLLTDMTAEGEYLIRRWRGQWMSYQGPHWAEDEVGAVRKWVYAQLENARCERVSRTGVPERGPWNPTKKKVDDVLDALSSIILLPEIVDPPTMLDSGEPAGYYIPCANGLLNVNDGKLYPSTPRYFGTVAVPFDYQPDAPEPAKLLRFLRQLWPMVDGVEAEEIGTLQEWFGYILSGRTDLQKILLLIGPRRSGKGTIARILTALVGIGNVAGPTLASLARTSGYSHSSGNPSASSVTPGSAEKIKTRSLNGSRSPVRTCSPWTVSTSRRGPERSAPGS